MEENVAQSIVKGLNNRIETSVNTDETEILIRCLNNYINTIVFASDGTANINLCKNTVSM